ncbi:LPD7 domain-containing protein, partial [Streptomyces cyaneofuscatus]|uniref:LPD7 domain-containing protein n=1 Tax=Streptomyces cyaneofuscatus TaxID=66883 RepID=UPI002FEF01CA
RQQLRTRQWDNQRTMQRERMDAIKKAFYTKRSRIQGDKALTGPQRKAALSVARMERITSEAAAKERAGIERDQLKASQRVPVMDQYRDFLAEKAQAGDEQALAELRRQRSEKTERITENEAKIEGTEAPAKQEREPIHRTQALTYQVHRNGDVTYQRAGRDVLRDEGRSVQMLQTDDKTIETGLRLAQQKFGRKLALSGPPEFQEKAARVAAEAGLQVEFTDARLNRIMRERTAELAAEKAREQEARKKGQEFAKQREEGKGKEVVSSAAKGPQKAAEQVRRQEQEKDQGHGL